jgi:hypothetical protein
MFSFLEHCFSAGNEIKTEKDESMNDSTLREDELKFMTRTKWCKFPNTACLNDEEKSKRLKMFYCVPSIGKLWRHCTPELMESIKQYTYKNPLGMLNEDFTKSINDQSQTQYQMFYLNMGEKMLISNEFVTLESCENTDSKIFMSLFFPTDYKNVFVLVHSIKYPVIDIYGNTVSICSEMCKKCCYMISFSFYDTNTTQMIHGEHPFEWDYLKQEYVLFFTEGDSIREYRLSNINSVLSLLIPSKYHDKLKYIYTIV